MKLTRLFLVLSLAVGAGCKRASPVAKIQLVAEAASREFNVPRDLLLAIAWSESRFSARHFPDAANGWVHLRPGVRGRDPLRVSARLKTPWPQLLQSPELGLRATAALLATNAQLENLGTTLMTFNSSPGLADELFADEVLSVMRSGIAGPDDDGVAVEIPPHPELAASLHVHEAPGPRPSKGAAFALYAPASSKAHHAPTATRAIKYIVIHTAEMSFSEALSYFARPDTNVAPHYIVRARDGLTIQTVDEADVAFHAACLNDESIGIEHEGWSNAGARWYSDAMYAASARLVRDIATRHGIPLDRQHVLGHFEAGCSKHIDPGSDWDWPRFMTKVAKATR